MPGGWNIPTQRGRPSLRVLWNPHVGRPEDSTILPCPTAPLVNYALRTYSAGDEKFKYRFEWVLEKETTELPFASVIHAALEAPGIPDRRAPCTT